MDGRGIFAARMGGGSINKNDGTYMQGESYGYAIKMRVAVEYNIEKNRLRYDGTGGSVNINQLAKRCQVSWGFANKIKKEVELHGRILRPSEIQQNRDVPRGAGAIVLDEFDSFIIMRMYDNEPSSSLRSYVESIYEYTGKRVSRSTVSRFFLHAFSIRGGFVKPNLVPYDKFRPANEAKAYEYLYMLSQIAPQRVKFGDEKLIKGQELYSRLVRRDPRTGDVPDIYTDGDFRNTHTLTGFCCIDSRTNPVWYRIHKETNDSEQFRYDIEGAVAGGFLLPGDVLVLDNVAYHSGKDNYILADWLWKDHGVFVLFLPARTPEWNPIELLWAHLVMKLRTYDLKKLRRRMGIDASAWAAKDILDKVSHGKIARYYRRCYRGIL